MSKGQPGTRSFIPQVPPAEDLWNMYRAWSDSTDGIDEEIVTLIGYVAARRVTAILPSTRRACEEALAEGPLAVRNLAASAVRFGLDVP